LGNFNTASKETKAMVMGELSLETELLVIGGGPGGYAAAFRAADLGMDVTMVDLASKPGGVCLHRGCIPSKTYLHVAELLHDAKQAQSMGISFLEPQIDLNALRQWKNQVVDQLAAGLVTLSNQRGVQMIRGRAVFEDLNQVRLHQAEIGHITFKQAIIATGSKPLTLPHSRSKKGGRVMTSTAALELVDIPPSLLVIGGGYVGLELGSVYAALGSRVCVVESGPVLLNGVDRDLVNVLLKRLNSLFEAIYLNTRVLELSETQQAVKVKLDGPKALTEKVFDRVLVAIGRKPTTQGLGLKNAGVAVDEQGLIKIDDGFHTSNPAIYAVGDVVGGLMLAHKAAKEGKIAAEIMAGYSSAFDARAIPAVIYTDPQIAVCGLTEEMAAAQNMAVKIRRFPWRASGRALTMGLAEGVTKMIIASETNRILGVGIAGRGAESLIAEAVVAIEMGALADDLALSIHPHPTLSETEGEVAEIFLGSATHVFSPK
jgi:dihydrolipoamide dehydrogenase